MEPPGLDFKEFGDRFFENVRRFLGSSGLLPAFQIHSKVWANCSQNVGFHFPMCLQQCSPADASLKCMAVPQHSCTQMGRRGWPPPGGVQWNASKIDVSKNMRFCHGFLLIFGCLLQEPNLKFHAPTQCFVSFSQKSNVRFWHAFLVQKTYRKPFQDEARTFQKSMPKTGCFSTLIFSRLGLDFGTSWASNLDPSPPRCLQRQAC